MTVRLDKWLFAARFYKSRALAREMIEGGKVHYNHQRTKPSKMVEIGDTITLRQNEEIKEIIIKQVSDIRGPASVAANYYQETEESIIKREKQASTRKLIHNISPPTKPSKKARREIIRFKNIHNS